MKPTRNVPDVVPVVLTQLARMYVAHEIPTEAFKQKIRRLCGEELDPRGLALLVRELPSGGIRFIIKDTATHSFVHMVESRCTSKAEKQNNDALPISRESISLEQTS